VPVRKTLGTNFGEGGGMLSAMGLASPRKPAEAEEAPPRPSRRAGNRAEKRPALSPAEEPSPPAGEPQAPLSDRTCRVATDISATHLDLAKRAAYWNRETLRNLLERAIEAEARRIADEQGLDTLPPARPLRRGRPLQP
jgi:hypothetical protein